MKIYIDADGCPVVGETVAAAKRHKIPVVLLCDTAHIFRREDVEVVTVSQGADSVDFALVNRVKPGDIVITQDYGLAALCLAKKARPLNQNGLIFTPDNIGALLLARHTSRKIRQAGGRTKGLSRRTSQQNRDFAEALEKLLTENHLFSPENDSDGPEVKLTFEG